VNNTMFNNSSNIEYNGNNGWIFRNTFSNGQIGIAMKGSYNNAFSNNTVLNNKIGMELVISDGNTIRNNNMVNNTKQVEVSGTNVWDGNYWSDYEGADNDEDGIGDTPYQITRGIEDKHPYMQRDGWLKNSTCLVTMENAASADIPKEERANTVAAKSFGVHTPATTHRLIKPILLESRQSY
jgi:parallel beta-helix repeat protein